MSYELFISRASPYSMKVAALLRYLGVEHRLVIQNVVRRYRLIRRLTGKTMVPVLRNGDWAINDSTAIAEYVLRLPQLARELYMPPGIDTLSLLLEDFADEWMVRWMVQSRWGHPEDVRHVEQLIGAELTGGLPGAGRLLGRAAGQAIRFRLEDWGIGPANAEVLSGSARRTLEALEAALGDGRLYLFGDVPSLADFGCYGPLGQYASDPSGARVLRSAEFGRVRAYVARFDAMLLGEVEVGSATDASLQAVESLMGEALGTYWEVMVANLEAMGQGKRPAMVEATLLDGASFVFAPSRYLYSRLQSWLQLIEEGYASRRELFGDGGASVERALIGRVEQLVARPQAVELLKMYPGLGLR
ncbi:hypothetical protein DL240_00070 [Lujinxingia litoralis]|uniref:GST N-terminal domain-containing protein n=1 Tax=Lujinxingia litoralis TaxID=2211119 RepID=A0A328C957_9DELT|nr:glutathione S-transferase family protein [Lujinxingia litoralis]RAL24642.1 hypothetical protein DL240_00070 [Lujinxingia litoralis]